MHSTLEDKLPAVLPSFLGASPSIVPRPPPPVPAHWADVALTQQHEVVAHTRTPSGATQMPQAQRPCTPCGFTSIRQPLRLATRLDPLERVPDGDRRPCLEPRALCPNVMSDINVIGAAVHLSDLDGTDTLIDLGCGDGAVLVAAARVSGARCIGIEVRTDCLRRTRRAAVDAGVPHLVDALDLDMTSASFEAHPCWQVATVVYAYLMPHMTQMLEPLLRRAVCAGKRVLLYCASGARVRRPGAPDAGNRIGDLAPAVTAMMGKLRLYCNDDVLAAHESLASRAAAERARQPHVKASQLRHSACALHALPPLALQPSRHSVSLQRSESVGKVATSVRRLELLRTSTVALPE